MKEEMMSQKSKQKIERVREMEAEAVKERKFGIPDAIRDIEVAKKSTTLQDSGLSENDLEKIVGLVIYNICVYYKWATINEYNRRNLLLGLLLKPVLFWTSIKTSLA